MWRLQIAYTNTLKTNWKQLKNFSIIVLSYDIKLLAVSSYFPYCFI